MAMTSNETLLPNLHTPLAFLKPQLAGQLEAARYLHVATLAVESFFPFPLLSLNIFALGKAYLWDLLCSLGQEYRLLTQDSLSACTVIYFLSRISTLAFIASSTFFLVAPVGSCHALLLALGCCWVVAAPSTSLLFFLRLWAVFRRQTIVIVCAAILWFATLGGSITFPLSINGEHIGNTSLCTVASVKAPISVSIVSSACYDTLVFIAVSWNIINRTAVNGKVMSFLCGRDLPYISRELLRSGQLYYLLTVGGNVLTIAMILSPSPGGPILRTMFVVPNLALENSMACRVFRNIKLQAGGYRDDRRQDTSRTDIEFAAYATRTIGGTEIKQTSGHVEVLKTVEKFDDNGPMRVSIHQQGAEDMSYPIGGGYMS